MPKGCQYCVRGEKLVVFVTGICPRSCYYCPLSDQKYRHDVIFANERKIAEFKDVLIEANNMNAKGAGITGGDPLAKIKRTCDYIRKLKEEFGTEFHIHLYTSLNLASEKNLNMLYKAGLDEIRFHPDLDNKELWRHLEIALQFKWDVGIEIPCIPDKIKEIKELIDFVEILNQKGLNNHISFINLNELEVADNKMSKLTDMGFICKDEWSYAVKNSVEVGLEIIKYVDKNNNSKLSVHLCTAKLKDAVQLANRLKREAAIVKKDFDIMNKEGLLTRGSLYSNGLEPGFDFDERFKNANKEKIISKLHEFSEIIKKDLQIKENMIFIDETKLRILLHKNEIKTHAGYFKKLLLVPAIVTEYPTADQLEVEVDFCE